VLGSDIDINSEQHMTASIAAKYASSGDLRLVVGRNITNSQIDLLTSSIDK